jgi:hypothetical protein
MAQTNLPTIRKTKEEFANEYSMFFQKASVKPAEKRNTKSMYAYLFHLFNLGATLRTLIGMMYFFHTFAQDARFRGLLALFSILPACSG